MGSSDPPDPRNPVKDYEKGIQVYLKYLDDLLAAEDASREVYDPIRVDQQQRLQREFGDEQTDLALDQLDRYDPEGRTIRGELGDQVLADLRNRREVYRGDEALPELPVDLRQEIESGVRGSQAARGNILGAGAGNAEALFKGRSALELYNMRLGLQDRERNWNVGVENRQRADDMRRFSTAGTFLSGPTPMQQAAQIPQVNADRSAAYTVGGLSAGAQGATMGQMAYQNQLASYNATPNPWATALTGAAAGASAGSAAGPYGAAAGAVVGGAVGYFSDIRLKENIVDTGRTENGLRKYLFTYIGRPLEVFEGVMAHEVEKLFPQFVIVTGNGIKAVNYEGLGIRFKKVS